MGNDIQSAYHEVNCVPHLCQQGLERGLDRGGLWLRADDRRWVPQGLVHKCLLFCASFPSTKWGSLELGCILIGPGGAVLGEVGPRGLRRADGVSFETIGNEEVMSICPARVGGQVRRIVLVAVPPPNDELPRLPRGQSGNPGNQTTSLLGMSPIADSFRNELSIAPRGVLCGAHSCAPASCSPGPCAQGDCQGVAPIPGMTMPRQGTPAEARNVLVYMATRDPARKSAHEPQIAPLCRMSVGAGMRKDQGAGIMLLTLHAGVEERTKWNLHAIGKWASGAPGGGKAPLTLAPCFEEELKALSVPMLAFDAPRASLPEPVERGFFPAITVKSAGYLDEEDESTGLPDDVSYELAAANRLAAERGAEADRERKRAASLQKALSTAQESLRQVTVGMSSLQYGLEAWRREALLRVQTGRGAEVGCMLDRLPATPSHEVMAGVSQHADGSNNWILPLTRARPGSRPASPFSPGSTPKMAPRDTGQRYLVSDHAELLPGDAGEALQQASRFARATTARDQPALPSRAPRAASVPVEEDDEKGEKVPGGVEWQGNPKGRELFPRAGNPLCSRPDSLVVGDLPADTMDEEMPQRWHKEIAGTRETLNRDHELAQGRGQVNIAEGASTDAGFEGHAPAHGGFIGAQTPSSSDVGEHGRMTGGTLQQMARLEDPHPERQVDAASDSPSGGARSRTSLIGRAGSAMSAFFGAAHHEEPPAAAPTAARDIGAGAPGSTGLNRSLLADHRLSTASTAETLGAASATSAYASAGSVAERGSLPSLASSEGVRPFEGAEQERRS